MFTSIILAADRAQEMKSETPLVLHKLCGKALCQWVIEESKQAGADNAAVIGDCAELVKNIIGNEYEYALRIKNEFLKNDCVVILNGNMPLITSSTIKSAVDCHKKNDKPVTVATAMETENKIYVFDADFIKAFETIEEALSAISIDKMSKLIFDDSKEFLTVNNRVDLSCAEAIMKKRINKKHMMNGVTIHNPESVYIEADVEIGEDTEIFQNVILKNGTRIGKKCVIGIGTVLDSAIIHDDVDILNSVIIKSEVESNTNVGPFAYIRPDCHVGSDVKVGDFVELKNANIGDGTKISHLTYVGDSDVGKKVNFGCGTVTVNYDGKKKYRTTIQDNAFIGCNTNLVSPVNVGRGAYIAAGSTITDDIPDDNLSIARARQVNKQVSEEWLNKRRK